MQELNYLVLGEMAQIDERAVRAIAAMNSNIEKYATRPDANQDVVELRKRDLRNLATYVQMARRVIIQLEEDNRTEFRRGFRAGVERGRKENSPLPERLFVNRAEKESYRAAHNAQARERWSDHY